jgi:hypothetical protein
MTHGYIIINPDNKKESDYFILASNKTLENNSPHPEWLHVLCVIRDSGDHPISKLLEYHYAYQLGGLTAIPMNLRAVWDEYIEHEKKIAKNGARRGNKYYAKVVSRSIPLYDKFADDPLWTEKVICEKCNRPVRKGLYIKKHGVNCTLVKVSDEQSKRLLSYFRN